MTGVTSELGCNLLEKLLRCFPGVKIHAVLRSREFMNQTDRIHKRIWNSPGCWTFSAAQ
uniref:FAR7 n=1 Tax=Tetrastichus brontispae TaxID=2033808 RepID=A0A650FKU6_9HYME|nr:FAR7 [Tetrastichus brontispae]